jgi:hypothetical protein
VSGLAVLLRQWIIHYLFRKRESRTVQSVYTSLSCSVRRTESSSCKAFCCFSDKNDMASMSGVFLSPWKQASCRKNDQVRSSCRTTSGRPARWSSSGNVSKRFRQEFAFFPSRRKLMNQTLCGGMINSESAACNSPPENATSNLSRVSCDLGSAERTSYGARR